jgi:hypothetical protein
LEEASENFRDVVRLLDPWEMARVWDDDEFGVRKSVCDGDSGRSGVSGHHAPRLLVPRSTGDAAGCDEQDGSIRGHGATPEGYVFTPFERKIGGPGHSSIVRKHSSCHRSPADLMYLVDDMRNRPLPLESHRGSLPYGAVVGPPAAGRFRGGPSVVNVELP